MSIGVRSRPRCPERDIKAMVEAAGGVYEPPAKRQKRDNPEHRYQIAVCRMLNLCIGPAGVPNRDGVHWRGFDQGQKKAQEINGKRVNIEATLAKARGVRRGVTDLLVTWPGRNAAWIELKADRGTVSDDQRHFMDAMRAVGWHSQVFYERAGAVAVVEWLERLGCPVRRVQ